MIIIKYCITGYYNTYQHASTKLRSVLNHSYVKEMEKQEIYKIKINKCSTRVYYSLQYIKILHLVPTVRT